MSDQNDFLKLLIDDFDQFETGTCSPPFYLPASSPKSEQDEVELLQGADLSRLEDNSQRVEGHPVEIDPAARPSLEAPADSKNQGMAMICPDNFPRANLGRDKDIRSARENIPEGQIILDGITSSRPYTTEIAQSGDTSNVSEVAGQKNRRRRGRNWKPKTIDLFVKLTREGYKWEAISERLEKELQVDLTPEKLSEKWSSLRKDFITIQKYERTAQADNQITSYWLLDPGKRNSRDLRLQNSSFNHDWFKAVEEVEQKKKSRKKVHRRRKGLSEHDKKADHQTGDSVTGCTTGPASADVFYSNQPAVGGGSTMLDTFQAAITVSSTLEERMLDAKEEGLQIDRQISTELDIRACKRTRRRTKY